MLLSTSLGFLRLARPARASSAYRPLLPLCSAPFRSAHQFRSIEIEPPSVVRTEKQNRRRYRKKGTPENQRERRRFTFIRPEMKRDADELNADDSVATKRLRTENETEETKRLDRFPKRKVAMLVGFCGMNYQGMQINEDCNSIEKHLQDAFVKAGAIAEFNADRLQKVSFMRCARTDKGVHALGQVVSFKMQLKESETMVERINSFLPSDIRVFGYVRVTNSFNSKNHCSFRVYQYMLPISALHPSSRHPQRDKPFNLDEVLPTVLETWKKFEGTHNFHNFTSKKLPDDPSNKRYMLDCNCEKMELQGESYLCFTVKGQSFMFNQIRKMIALVVCIVRDGMEPALVDGCLTRKELNLHIAPGHGLLLRACDFSAYESTRGKDREQIVFADLQSEVERFREEVIVPKIIEVEKLNESTKKWLNELDEYTLNYDEMRIGGTQ